MGGEDGDHPDAIDQGAHGREVQARRTELLEIVNIFRAKVCDVSDEAISIEVTGSDGKLTAFVEMMETFGIDEMVRSGKIAIARS